MGGAGWQAGSWVDTSDVYLSVSVDDGMTFTDPVQVNPPGTSAILPAIAAAGQGNIVMSWLQTPVGDAHPADAARRGMAAVSSNAHANQTLEARQVTPDPVNAAATGTAG